MQIQREKDIPQESRSIIATLIKESSPDCPTRQFFYRRAEESGLKFAFEWLSGLSTLTEANRAKLVMLKDELNEILPELRLMG